MSRAHPPSSPSSDSSDSSVVGAHDGTPRSTLPPPRAAHAHSRAVTAPRHVTAHRAARGARPALRAPPHPMHAPCHTMHALVAHALPTPWAATRDGALTHPPRPPPGCVCVQRARHVSRTRPTAIPGGRPWYHGTNRQIATPRAAPQTAFLHLKSRALPPPDCTVRRHATHGSRQTVGAPSVAVGVSAAAAHTTVPSGVVVVVGDAAPRPRLMAHAGASERPFLRSPPVPGPLGGEIIIWSMFGRSLELPLLLPPPPDPHLAMPDLRERFFSRRSRSR